MHPYDQARTSVLRVRLQAESPDRVGVLQHRLRDDPHRNRVRAVERCGHLPRVLVDLAQRVVAVQVLAACGEPDLELTERLHAHADARYSLATISVSSSTDVSEVRRSNVMVPFRSRFTRSATSNTWM